MPNVTIKFNNQNYHLACKDGEGDRLQKLAEYVEGKAALITKGMGPVSDSRLLLMTAILLADELDEARSGKPLAMNAAEEKASKMEKTLIHTLKRIENITRQVEAEG